jgi:hypothetical protein
LLAIPSVSNDMVMDDVVVVEEIHSDRPNKCLRMTGYGLLCCLVVVVALVTTLMIGLTKGFSSTNQLEEADSLDYGSGYPVWSDDDISIAGVDMYWSEGLIFPPLQGWTGSVNPRFKVFVQEWTTQISSNCEELCPQPLFHEISGVYPCELVGRVPQW